MSRLTSRPIQGPLDKMNVTLKITDDFSGGWLKNHSNIYMYYKDKQTQFLIQKHIWVGFKKKRQTSGKLGK